jgi:hypothetical protein
MREELLEDAKKRASHGTITFDPETAKAETMALFSKHHIECQFIALRRRNL